MNKAKFRLDDIEAEIFCRLHDHLMHPAYIEEYIRSYDDERRALAEAPQPDISKLERAVAEARSVFERRLALYDEGVLEGEDGKARVVDAKTRLRTAEELLSATQVSPEEVKFDPATAPRFAAALRNLMESMAAPDGKPDPKACAAVRTLISDIIVSPAKHDGVPIEVRGRMSALIANPELQVGGSMVAEEGLEPPTRGL